MSATRLETKTIHEFLAENPNVDVSRAWERCWGIHTGIVERVQARFPVTRHPTTFGRDYYTSPDQQMEGSFTAFTGPQIDWLVHSWVGNRKASLLDMNATVFLGQDTQVPHLIVIFGTIPKLFFYCDYVPRADLRVDLDYLQRYYEPANADYLQFRGNPAFTWSVSHGTYLRGLLSPVCSSYIMDLSEENIDACERYLEGFVGRWFKWLDEAPPVAAADRPALQAYDFKLREYGYRQDPMNVLVERVFGKPEYERMLDLRIGMQQIAEARARG